MLNILGKTSISLFNFTLHKIYPFKVAWKDQLAPDSAQQLMFEDYTDRSSV